MRESVLSKIVNVKRAANCISYLQNRAVTEMVGLGLIYGAPGLGKTRYVKRTALRNNYVYIRLESTSTNKSFILSLIEALSHRLSIELSGGRRTTNELFKECLQLINEDMETVIVIDEIDYAFRKKDLLGTIRDIADETIATVLLVGMSNARTELLKANSHYFDRCNYFCQFLALELADVRLVCTDVAEVEIANDLVTYIHKKSLGNLRRIMKMIHLSEIVARKKNLDVMTANDYPRKK